MLLDVISTQQTCVWYSVDNCGSGNRVGVHVEHIGEIGELLMRAGIFIRFSNQPFFFFFSLAWDHIRTNTDDPRF